jgi:lysozyme
MTPTIIDLFHGDAAGKMPDMATVASQGIWAIVHKASQGMSYRDPMFDTRIIAAQDAGMLTGAYHFLTSDDVVAQANLFLAQVRPFVSGNFALFVDYEKSGATPALHQCWQFMTLVETAVPQALCGLYSGDLIRETLRRDDFTDSNQRIVSFFATRRLWLAEYGPHERIPWPWSEHPEFCDMWQYSETGRLKAILGPVDFNVFTGGDRDTLTRVWKSGQPQPARMTAGASVGNGSNRGAMT